MKRINILFYPVIIILILITSCSLQDSRYDLRISFEHSFGNPLNIKVILTENNGISLNGARVILSCPDSTSKLLEYNSNSCCYTATIYSPSEGTYTITPYVNGSQNDGNSSISFIPLTEKPIITDVSDALGNSSNLGVSLSLDSDVLVSYGTVTEADRYKIYIYNVTNLVYSISGSDSEFIIPSEYFIQGNYSVIVEAQKVYGDPLLVNENYYSVSSSSSATYIFQVE